MSSTPFIAEVTEAPTADWVMAARLGYPSPTKYYTTVAVLGSLCYNVKAPADA